MSHRNLQGRDLAHYARQVGEQLERDYEEDCKRADEHERRAKSESERHHKYFATVDFVGTGFIATCTEPHPLVGKLQAFGRDPSRAMSELRYVLAKKLFSMGFAASFDDCRRHACRSHFERVEL